MTTTNIAFWGKALKTIPRISKDEWNALDIISRWLVATRASVFIMTSISCAIGGLLAYAVGSFNVMNFIVCFIGLNFAHASNNLINDWIDYKNGVDKENYFRALYGPQLLEHQYVGKKTFGLYILVSLAVAMLAGIYLVANTSSVTMLLMAFGLFFLIFYTWPLKHLGIGEPSVVLVWGPLMIGGAYYVTTGGQWSWDVALIGLVYAIGPTSVIFGKHIDKLQQDKVKGVHTLPVIIGEKAARWSVIALWILQIALFIFLVFNKTLGWPILLIILSVPVLWSTIKIYLQPRPASKPDNYDVNAWPLYLVRYAFVYNRRFSLLFLLGLILHVVLVKFGIIG
jgi:1,4-dihydroxy-2-naphthoate octaprenyltransferase